MLDGVHLVRAYLERFGAEGVELVVRRSAAGHKEILPLVEHASASIMSDTLFDQLAPVESPVGVLALAPLPTVTLAPAAERRFEILLDGIQDPGNVGAILRSAAAAGAREAHLSVDCADPWSPKCLRGGMGAQMVLPVQQHENLALAARSLDARLIALHGRRDDIAVRYRSARARRVYPRSRRCWGLARPHRRRSPADPDSDACRDRITECWRCGSGVLL